MAISTRSRPAWNDARRAGAEVNAFLGDAIGCCGHSEQVVERIVEAFDVCVAGNHEHQAVARAETCGCGYSSPDDEAIGCEAFQTSITAELALDISPITEGAGGIARKLATVTDCLA